MNTQMGIDQVLAQMRQRRENARYLPGFAFPSSLQAADPSADAKAAAPSAGTRCGVPIASGRSLPSRARPIAPDSVLKVPGTRPATTSCNAGAAPR